MSIDPVPEFVGPVLTPAATAGCILPLHSPRPYANAAAFAAAFVVLHAVGSVIVLATGGTVEPTEDTASANGVVADGRGLTLTILCGFGAIFAGRGLGDGL